MSNEHDDAKSEHHSMIQTKKLSMGDITPVEGIESINNQSVSTGRRKKGAYTLSTPNIPTGLLKSKQQQVSKFNINLLSNEQLLQKKHTQSQSPIKGPASEIVKIAIAQNRPTILASET